MSRPTTPRSRRVWVTATALVVALVLAAAAFAASQNHLPGGYYPGGTGSSSSYSSSWKTEGSHAEGSTDRTVTLIDNASYSWHGTMRSASADIYAHWYSSAVKKGHCRLNQGGSVGCTVFNF